MRQLIAELDIQGCMIAADALNCQKETAEAVVKGKGDYLLTAKGNQPSLEREIRDYVQEESLRKAGIGLRRGQPVLQQLLTGFTEKKNGKIYAAFGAIKTEFERKGVKSKKWHHYISSRNLTAPELLHYARME